MDYQKLLKQNRRKPMTALPGIEGGSLVVLSYGQDDIKKLIPHRDPFLFIDRLTGLDLTEDQELIIGSRVIPKDDPVFKGHFPDFPVYPGSLQLEMSGQLGLCLTHFFLNKTDKIEDDANASPVRATKVLGALFLEPVYPGSEVTIISKKLEYDGYFGTVLSQVITDGKIACVSIAEVIFLDEE